MSRILKPLSSHLNRYCKCLSKKISLQNSLKPAAVNKQGWLVNLPWNTAGETAVSSQIKTAGLEHVKKAFKKQSTQGDQKPCEPKSIWARRAFASTSVSPLSSREISFRSLRTAGILSLKLQHAMSLHALHLHLILMHLNLILLIQALQHFNVHKLKKTKNNFR